MSENRVKQRSTLGSDLAQTLELIVFAAAFRVFKENSDSTVVGILYLVSMAILGVNLSNYAGHVLDFSERRGWLSGKRRKVVGIGILLIFLVVAALISVGLADAINDIALVSKS